MLKRLIKTFVPKDPVTFTNEGKLKIFEYHDENTLRSSLLMTMGSQTVFLAYSLVSFNSLMPLIGFGLASLFSIQTYRYTKKVVSRIDLLKDGKNLEIVTYDFFRKKTHLIPIEIVNSSIGKEGYKIFVDNKVFVLEQEGKIWHPELFIAIMRSLCIDDNKFKTDKSVSLK